MEGLRRPRLVDVNDAERRRASLRAFFESRGLSTLAVAKRSKVPNATLYGYLQGATTNLNMEACGKIARALDTTVDAMFSGQDAAGAARALVCGVMGINGSVGLIRPLHEIVLPAIIPANGRYRAYELGSYVMPPAERGWLLVFQEYDGPVSELVGTTGCYTLGDGRTVFRRLRAGTNGRYNLESWGTDPAILNAEVLSGMTFVALVSPAAYEPAVHSPVHSAFSENP